MTAIVVQQLDFLPDKFRNAVRRRRASYWRVIVVLMFVGVFVAAACGLQSVRSNVRREYELTTVRYLAAQAQEATLKSREAKLAELRAYADLAAFLRHPWPRSQLIEHLFAPLPQTVIIEKLHLSSEPRPTAAGAGPSSEAGGENAPERTATTDLSELRQGVEANDLVIHLEGTTVDQPGLHSYLHRLTDGKLFRRAEIESIEAARAENAGAAVPAGASRFTARVVVRPGWGMTDGPSPDELTVGPVVSLPDELGDDEP